MATCKDPAQLKRYVGLMVKRHKIPVDADSLFGGIMETTLGLSQLRCKRFPMDMALSIVYKPTESTFTLRDFNQNPQRIRIGWF